jgi:hypothetical protein
MQNRTYLGVDTVGKESLYGVGKEGKYGLCTLYMTMKIKQLNLLKMLKEREERVGENIAECQPKIPCKHICNCQNESLPHV